MLFELIQIEVQCSKNFIKIFLLQEAVTFGKPTPKIEKICIIYIPRVYLLCLQSNASGSFLQKCINFLEQQLKFSHFEGSIIP